MMLIYIKSLIRLDYLIFYLWIIAASVGLYMQQGILPLVMLLGSFASFIAYLIKMPPRIFTIKRFIMENEIDKNLLGMYLNILGSKEADTYFYNREFSKMLVSKIMVILRNHEEYDINCIYIIAALFNRHWDEIKANLSILPPNKQLRGINISLAAFSFSLNLVFINNKKFFSSLIIVKKISDYIYLNLMTDLNKEFLENLDYYKINVVKLSKMINKILGESKMYEDIEEYKKSDFKYVLDFYLYLIDVLIILEKMDVSLKSKSVGITEVLSELRFTTALKERMYRDTLKSTNQKKVFIARDVQSYLDVIKKLG